MTEQPIQTPTLEEIVETMTDIESRVHFQGEDEEVEENK